MFGYTEEELIGNSVSELLLTPAMRENWVPVPKLLETKRGVHYTVNAKVRMERRSMSKRSVHR